MAAVRSCALVMLAVAVACNYGPSRDKPGSSPPIGVPTGPPSPPPLTPPTRPVVWDYAVAASATPPASPAIIDSWVCQAFSGSITDTGRLTSNSRTVGYDSSGTIQCAGGPPNGAIGFVTVNLLDTTITPVRGLAAAALPTFVFCPAGPPPAVPCISLTATVAGTDTLSGSAAITVERLGSDSTVAVGTFTAIKAP